MEVYFRDERTKRVLNDQSERTRKFGSDCARKIEVRLQTLAHASSLAEVFLAPGHCHPLKGNRNGQYALDLAGGFRLVFTPADAPLALRADGSVELSKVQSVTVLEVTDYHG